MPRPIKSFVLRSGRITERQQTALNQVLSSYELPKSRWNFEQIFKRTQKTVVEIGFGMGTSLIQMAENNPDINYIGIEVHKAGIGSILADIAEKNIDNIKLATFDAVEVFQTCVPDNSLDGIQIFFPDPWPKKRHHKRRLIQSGFVNLLAKKLKKDAIIHCASDWQDYAEHIKNILSQEVMLENIDINGGFVPRPEFRPLTKFEKRGLNLGHQVWDILFRRV